MKIKVEIIKADEASGLKKGDKKMLDIPIARSLIERKFAKEVKKTTEK